MYQLEFYDDRNGFVPFAHMAPDSRIVASKAVKSISGTQLQRLAKKTLQAYYPDMDSVTTAIDSGTYVIVVSREKVGYPIHAVISKV